MNPSKEPTKDKAKARSKPNPVLGIMLLLIACLFWILTIQSKRISSLHEDYQHMASRMEQHQKQSDQQLKALQQEIEELKLATQSGASQGDPKLDAIDVADMENGLYSYTDKIKMSATSGGRKSSYQKEYKVSVIKTGIGAGDYKLDFVVGLATCTGLPQFFVDYDGDKLVDLDIMKELVDSMPFGSLLGKKMNIGNSQNLYDNFLLNHERADHLAPSDINEKGGAVAKSLWKVITDQSGKITDWIQK